MFLNNIASVFVLEAFSVHREPLYLPPLQPVFQYLKHLQIISLKQVKFETLVVIIHSSKLLKYLWSTCVDKKI